MSISGEQTITAPGFRFTDRAYIAWATVAVAYAIAFLQRVSPQSVGLSFMHGVALGAAVAVLTVMFSALTFIPAMIGGSGRFLP